MSDVLIPIKGGGSVSSDELTAAMSDVLKGKTAVTSDSDDEAIVGTMPNLSADSTISCSSDLPNLKVVTNSTGPWIYTNTDGTSRMVIQYRGDNGYIQSNTMIGVAATNLGTTAADKVLSGYRFSSSAGINISGTMPNNSTTTSNGTVPGISSSYSAVPTREGTSLQLQTDTNGTKRISICPPQGYYPGPSNGGSYVNRPASDFGTATKDKVLSGSTFTSEAGVKVSGSMTDQGAVTSSLNCGGSYTIPAGYHNGSGKVTANSLSSQTSADATAANILSGKTAWVNGSKITGTIASKAAATYTPGTSNQTIAAGQYLSGAQTIKGDSNLVQANILRGKSIFGVSGSTYVLKFIQGSRISGTTGYSCQDQNATSSYKTFYYIDTAPGFTPVYAVGIGDGSIVWRVGDKMNVGDSYGGYFACSGSNWPFTSSQCRIPIPDKSFTTYYWIFGY